MAPIVLKVKGNMQSLPFGNDSSDDLSKTWRVCTKVKDSLENGSRLENLSWRLWFAHNVNDSTKKKSTVSPAASALLRNFKVPDNFDFKAQKKPKDLEADYRRKLSLQQKKQAEQKIQDAANKMLFAIPKPSLSKETNRKQPQQSVDTFARSSKEFRLHQYTSDQANDQVIELDDIFKSFGDDMQAYLDPSEENLTSQQLDNLINESWPLSCASSYADNSLVTSPVTLNFPSSVMAPPPPAAVPHQQQMYSQQEYSGYNGYITNNNNENDNLQGSALYVSSEAMPPIPLGTLHNKLLTTLPKETLESAGRLLLSNKSEINQDAMMIDQKPHSTATFPSVIQSTPNTPFVTTSSSFSAPHQGSHLNPQQQLLQQQMEEPSYQFFVQQQQQAPAPNQRMLNNIPTSFTFSYHNHPQSKSLPPSRATSPPPCDTGGSSSSASSSPTSVLSPSSSPKKRATIAINSSPSEGKAPVCSNCSTTSTPLWRRSANDELLCNACGLYLKLHNAPRPKYLKPQSSRKDSKEDENVVQPLCSNCGTSTTPLWRRDLDGAPLCNACGLYLKLHHEKRPLSMKTDNIKKRQRCDNGSSLNANKISSVTSNVSKRKNHRVMEEPLTTTVTFDTKYQYMEDVVPSNSATSSSSSLSDSNYSPFGQFGLTITHQPI